MQQAPDVGARLGEAAKGGGAAAAAGLRSCKRPLLQMFLMLIC
jgi:hypothetical protein